MIIPSSALFFALRFIVHAERAKRRHALAPRGATFWPLHTALDACAALRILATLPSAGVAERLRRRALGMAGWAMGQGVQVDLDGREGPDVIEGRGMGLARCAIRRTWQ